MQNRFRESGGKTVPGLRPIGLILIVVEENCIAVAAVSTLIIGLTVLVLIAGDRLVGLNRMAWL
jgi:hypothetical protein